ncbi:MAG: hypothetical protein KDN20_13950 [Verrucomicrobiae bacterium]|nr:hypothetical protein [Verrucomicrobiae bacterium]
MLERSAISGSIVGTMWNIVIGIIFVIGGLSGKMALIGTNSGGLLALLGAGLIAWGIVQKVRTPR